MLNVLAPTTEMRKLVYRTIPNLQKNNLPYNRSGVKAFIESAYRLNKQEEEELDDILMWLLPK
jgi:hypothetical protein